MRRRLFTFVSILSLLLCAAVCALWVRSLGHFEIITLRHQRWTSEPEVRSSYAGFSWFSNTFRIEVISVTYKRTTTAGSQAADLPGLRWDFVGENVTLEMNGYPPGFEAGRYPYTPTGQRYVLAVRPWLPAALAAVLPVVWIGRRLRTRRARRRGLCPACGYDLRATPDRCPECGLVSAAG